MIMETNVTAKQAWIVKMRLLQNSKDGFGNTHFLNKMKPNVHALEFIY